MARKGHSQREDEAAPELPRLVQYEAHPTSGPIRVQDAAPTTDRPQRAADED